MSSTTSTVKRPSRRKAKSGNNTKTIRLTSEPDQNVLLIGSSVSMNAKPGEWVSEVSLYPVRARYGVIAVASQDKLTHEWESRLIPVSRSPNGQIKVNLKSSGKKQFVDSAERIFKLYDGAGDEPPHLEIRIGKFWYTTNPSRVGPEVLLVNDPNLLCRYIAYDCGARAITKVASRPMTEKQLRNELRTAHDRCLKIEGELQSADRREAALIALAKNLASYLRKRWVKSKRLKALLASDLLSY